MWTYKITIGNDVYEQDFEEELDAYNFALTKFGYIMSDNSLIGSIFKVIEIETIVDDVDCETCGGNYAVGAKIKIDSVAIPELYFEPFAHCYDGISYENDVIYTNIIEYLKLPITVNQVYVEDEL